jgi:ABC-2 type transport system permease protein
MRVVSCFIKTFKENVRDWKILILVLTLGPFFIFIMYLYLSGTGVPSYTVAVTNLDTEGVYASEFIGNLESLKNTDGSVMLKVSLVEGAEKGRQMIRNRDADVLITIPPDFSASFEKYLRTREGKISALINYGDQSNLKYMTAASLVDFVAYSYVAEQTGTESPVEIKYESVTSGKELREFDLYVPALFVLSLIMVLFSAAATLVREVEKGTIVRLKLSRLSSLEYMSAVSLNQLLIGTACLALTFLSALAVGYETKGSLMLFLLVGAATCFSVIAISIITACFIENMFGLLTIGCFPFFILMFFSDCFMPLPKINLFAIAGNQLYVNDILPTAIATRAFSKILTFNASFSDVAFEFVCIIVLSCVYFSIGAWLFNRKHLSRK